MHSSSNEETIHHQHDTSYRFLLSSKKLFVELLRSFIDKGWVQAVDEEHIEEIPHSFVLQDFKRQEADLVYRVNLSGQDVVFYLLFEMQSTVDFRMPYRLLLYQVEVWRYLLQNEPNALKNQKSFHLPPIIPIVLYNGKRKWNAVRQFRHLLANESMFGSELLNFEYLLIDAVRYTEEELFALSNTIGAVLLLDRTEDKEQLLNLLDRLLHTIQRMPDDNQRKFYAWMARMILPKLPAEDPQWQELLQGKKGDEVFMGLKKVLDDIERKSKLEGKLEGKIEGKIEGKQEGKQEAKDEIAKRMIDLGLEASVIAAATGFSPEQIEQLQKSN